MADTSTLYLLTGATGFLGRIIVAHQPEPILSLGRGVQNDICCDLSMEVPELPQVHTVIHNAGKAHIVPKTQAEARAFFAVNEQGTRNLLKGLEVYPPKYFIFISTVAVYGLDQAANLSEDTALKGETAYAQSKIKAEQAIQTWCLERDIPHLILRLPLVAGENPPGNLGAIWRMICKGRYLRIRRNVARKSMVLAKDVAQLIANWDGSTTGIYHLTDGEHPRFCDLEDTLAQTCGRKLSWQLPLSLLNLVGRVGDRLHRWSIPFPLSSARLQKMTQTLTFSDEKARQELGWSPQPVLDYLAGLSS